MNRKHTAALILTLSCLGAAASAGVSAEDLSDASIRSLFYTYGQDNQIFDYQEEVYVDQAGYPIPTYYDGFLSLEETDLNGDGQEELLAIRIKKVDEQNDLIAEVYEHQGNTLQRVAQQTLMEHILYMEDSYVDVFLQASEAGRMLCCESSETIRYNGNGCYWRVRAVSYDGNAFSEYFTPIEYNGSALTDEELAPAYQAVNSIGLYPDALFVRGISTQTEVGELLLMVRKVSEADYSEVKSFRENGQGEKLAYGKISFYSPVNTDLANKETSQTPFSTLGESQNNHSVEEITTGGGNAGAVSPAGQAAASEYVLPESNSRLLTSADLDALSEYEVYLARNEIYARHGRIFRNADLVAYFGGKSWYSPSIAPDDFTEAYRASVFNTYEIQNVDIIVAYENAHGYTTY
ncbi:MAG: YARHG domain-containing protein [Eubacteriales bacterium]|nr:YARHG domain-containing protein [Eubacteriales bacterium]